MARRAIFLAVTLICFFFRSPLSWATQQKTPGAVSAGSHLPASCQPKEGKTRCESCQEKNCCVERRACDNDPACAAFLNCLRTSCPTPPCLTRCGAAPKTYVDRFVCQMEKCNEPVCGGPVDACTLCTNTRCASEAVACRGTQGCSEYLSCKAACKQAPACVARCKETHAGAASVAEAQEACLNRQCTKECGKPSDPAHHGDPRPSH